MKVKYNAEANADKVAIGIYTIQQWGLEQWERYRAQLTAACEQSVAARLKRAKPVAGFPGVLRWRSGRHVIYFRRVDDGIEILRILHGRMLPAKHLR